MFSIEPREWASGKLVKYESLQVSNGWVGSGRVGSKMVKLRVDILVPVHTVNFNFLMFIVLIIEIVEYKSGRIAKKFKSIWTEGQSFKLQG